MVAFSPKTSSVLLGNPSAPLPPSLKKFSQGKKLNWFRIVFPGGDEWWRRRGRGRWSFPLGGAPAERGVGWGGSLSGKRMIEWSLEGPDDQLRDQTFIYFCSRRRFLSSLMARRPWVTPVPFASPWCILSFKETGAIDCVGFPLRRFNY